MGKNFDDVADLLDQVKSNCKIRFDGELADLLGINGNYLSQLRTGRAVPSPTLMIKIANLAFADVEQALMLREYLAAKTPEEKFIWLRAKKKLAQNGLNSAILALALSFHFSSAKFDLPLSNSFDVCSDINCAAINRLRRRLMKWRRALLGGLLDLFTPMPRSSCSVLVHG